LGNRACRGSPYPVRYPVGSGIHRKQDGLAMVGLSHVSWQQAFVSVALLIAITVGVFTDKVAGDAFVGILSVMIGYVFGSETAPLAFTNAVKCEREGEH